MATIVDIKLPRFITQALRMPVNGPQRQQLRVLKKLLKKARFTSFGQKYLFDSILLEKNITKAFSAQIPVHDYNKIYNEWWHKTLEGVPDITWPGKIKYYALSSGTSEAASKYIPVTKEMLRSNSINYIAQFMSLLSYQEANKRAMTKGFLMLGGATDLNKGKAGWFAGDLSGILAKKRPFWFQTFYKPGGRIAAIKDWNHKLNEIVLNAKNWDIAYIVGVPAWCQMCIEMVIEHYKVKNIHEIWPNFSFFVHGGVAFEPYKKSFEKLLGKPIVYIENYLSSEGFIGYKTREAAKGMQLILNNNIFFEFVPFEDKNFDSEGNITNLPETKLVHELELEKEYAILISTNSGSWRYLLGDTVKLVDKQRSEIIITGRIKHFLSLVGEHLSVDNMNKALKMAMEEFNISIPEFTVAGEPFGNFYAHKWYIGTNDKIDADKLKQAIDKNLCFLNDDYAIERASALKEIFVEILPENIFLDFMKAKGKLGSQHKFPRVMKGSIYESWKNFLLTGSV